MFVNIARSSRTKKSLSFELVSEINVDDIYTFGSEFVPFEEATDVFIDTVKIKCENVFIYTGWRSKWRYDESKYQYFFNIPVNDTNIKLTFRKNRNDDMYFYFKKGTVYVEFSVSNVLYGTNVCGISSSDVNTLYEKLASLLTEAGVILNFDDSHLDFKNYKVTRIDRSFCFDAGSEKRKKEYLRIFKNLRIPYHDSGRCKNFDDYDYETGFSHGSDSSDFILYDKNEELREHKRVEIEADNEIKINVLRLEIRCRKPKGKKSDFGLFGEVLNNNNQTLLDILKQYRLDLKILPEQEFFKTIKDFLAKERNLHKGEKSRKLPKYLRYKDETILEFFQYINDYSEVAAYSANSTLFNACKTITAELGIMNLYTIIDNKLSFIDNALSHYSSIEDEATPLEEVFDEHVIVNDKITKKDDKPYKGVSIAYLIINLGKQQKIKSGYLFVVDFFNLIENKQPIPYKRE